MTEPPAQKPTTSKPTDALTSEITGNGWRKWLSPRHKRFWLVVLLVGYTLGGFFLTPWLLEYFAVREASKIDRTLNIGKIRFNPYVLSLGMENLELLDTDGELLLAYDETLVNFQVSSLFRWAWTFREIRLAGLRLNFESFENGDNRFGKLLDSFPAEEADPEPGQTGGMPRLLIYHFDLQDAQVDVVDHVEGEVFVAELGPVNVDVYEFSTLPDNDGRQQVSIETEGGGSIAWQGSLDVNPLRSVGRLTIVGRSLVEATRYANMILPIHVSGDGVDIAFDYHLRVDEAGKLRFSMENIVAHSEGFTIAMEEDGEPLLSIPATTLEGGEMHWPEQTVALASVTLSEPVVNVERLPDNSLNLDRLVAAIAAPDEPAAPALSADRSAAVKPSQNDGDWEVSVNRLAVNRGTANIVDQTTEPEARFALQNVTAEISGADNRPGSEFPLEMTLEMSTGGSVGFTGQIAVLPDVKANGAVRVSELAMQAAQPWVNGLARVTVDSGMLGLDGEVMYGPDEPGAYQGAVEIQSFVLADMVRDEQLAGWEQLDISRAELSLGKNTIETSRLEFNELYGRLAIAADKSTNLDGLLIEAETTNSNSSGEEPAAEALAVAESADPVLADSQPMAITIGGVDIAEASLDFSDLSLPLPFAAAIRSLDGTISTLATQSDESARVELDGQVNEFGQAKISGSINAWAPGKFTDIQMVFRNLEMNRITPYTVQFAGWKIDAGRLDLDLDYKIKGGQLNGDNAIVIREMVVGEKVENPDGTSLPLKLAVALLKDSNGVIDIDLPVSGDVNNPEFSIGGVVVKAIFNVITKVITAPFRLLGSLVGNDSEDFGTLTFDPGSAELSPPDREKLQQLESAMAQRPELALDIAGVYSPASDRAALKEIRVDEQLEARIEVGQAEGEELSTVSQRREIEAMFLEQFPDEPLETLKSRFMRTPDVNETQAADDEPAEPILDETAYVEGLRQSLIDAQEVTQQELTALADARAEAIIAALGSMQDGAPEPMVRSESVEVESEPGQPVQLELKVAVNEDAAQ